MPEKDLYEHRISALEADVKHLYSKVNGFAVASAEMNTKLDSMLVTLGELKESETVGGEALATVETGG